MSRPSFRRASPIAILTLVITSAVIATLLAACGSAAPTQPPPSSGPVIQVSPSQDLATAAKDAPAGATLALADGTYSLANTLAVSKDLTLKGSGAGNVTITMATVTTPSIGAASVRSAALGTEATSVNPVVNISGGTFTASGITFAYTGTAATDVVIAYNDAKLDITGCTFTGGVEGTGSLDYIGNGLGMYGTVSGTVKDSTFTDNGHAGFAEDDANDVAISNSTSTNNKWGGVFWGTTKGSLKGSTLSNNSVDGVILGAASGGPTTVIDGNTIENNGVDGILYTGVSAGTASNNTISGNGAKGIRVTDSAHPTLSGNDLHGNIDDGIAYEGDSSGTANGNQIQDNGSDSLGSKGIRVVGTAHPTLENNQITGNHLEGISYEESGGGTAEGNTVSSNIATGIAVRNQATPTVSGNIVQNNGNCGLLLQGDANPTLSGNTVSGNGQDLCDQRTGPSVAPIAHTCSTANSGLNPDPSRYLAVVARDATDAPIAGVSVSVSLFDDHGSQVGSDIETTDSNGVALLLDKNAYGWLAQGTFSGTIGVGASTTTPALFTACSNISNPGTITVDPTGLSDVTVNVHAGTTAATNVDAQPGFVYGAKARIGPAISLFSAPSHVKMLDGAYTFALRATIGSATYLLYPSVSVGGTTTLDVDTNQAQITHVTYSASIASGATVTNTESHVQRSGPVGRPVLHVRTEQRRPQRRGRDVQRRRRSHGARRFEQYLGLRLRARHPHPLDRQRSRPQLRRSAHDHRRHTAI